MVRTEWAESEYFVNKPNEYSKDVEKTIAITHNNDNQSVKPKGREGKKEEKRKK